MDKHIKSVKQILCALTLTISLSHCTTTKNDNNAVQSPSDIAMATEQLQQIMTKWSQLSGYQQSIKPISQCRFEIYSQWSNPNQGFYRATSKQRFSFTHDLRSIDHTPDHIIEINDKPKQLRQSLDITFNRPLPITTSYYDTNTFEHFNEQFTAGDFSILGVYKAPPQLISQLKASLSQIATLCGNDLTQRNRIQQKILGNWELHSQNKLHSVLNINQQQIMMQDRDGDLIVGPYQITQEQNYYRLTITPHNQQPVNFAIEFINSVFARVLKLTSPSDKAQFTPINDYDQSLPNNKKPLSLIRLGDIL